MEPQPKSGNRLYGHRPWRVLCGGVSLLVLLLWGLAAPSEVPSTELFPVPDVLRPTVAFWKKVFAEVGVTGGVLHDMKDPGIIYETLEQLPSNGQERQQAISGYRDYYQTILFTLAGGKREDLSSDEARVLAMFQGKDSPEVLQEAAGSMRFQGGMRERFMRGIVRSGAYRPDMERIFAAYGLPVELTYLPHVESSFENRALSKVGAAGVWQIMPATGRRFLTVNGRVDERLDIPMATVAAAQIFQENYEQLGTWPLAITAYNHGLYGMKQAVETMGTQDFGVIFQHYRGPLFGFASQNFYAEFLAALEVAQNPARYFEDLPLDAPVPFSTMASEQRDSGAAEERTPPPAVLSVLPASPPPLREPPPVVENKQAYSPPPLREPPPVVENKQVYSPSPAVPLQSRDAWLAARGPVTIPSPGRTLQSRDSSGSESRTTILVPPITTAPQVRESTTIEDHGSPVTSSARQTRDTVRQAAKNSLLVQDTTGRPGRAAAQESKPATAVPTSTYRVQPGDTLTTIAQKFRTTVAELSALNHLPSRYMVKKGETLALATSAPEAGITEPSVRHVVSKATVEDAARKPAVDKTVKKSAENATAKAIEGHARMVVAASLPKEMMARTATAETPRSGGASMPKVSAGRPLTPDIPPPVMASPSKVASGKSGVPEGVRSVPAETSKLASASTARLVAIKAPVMHDVSRPTALVNVTKTSISTRTTPRRAPPKGA